MTQRELIRHLLSDGSVRRSTSLLADGVQPQALADALEAGVIVRAAPGAYHLATASSPSGLLAVAAAAVRAPKAVVCLTTAAHFCGLLDEAPATVWLALPAGARIPRLGGVQEQVMHWSFRGAFDLGVVEDTVCGVGIRRTDAPRTVVDLLRYARYVGGEETGLRAGFRFVRQGGDPGAVLAAANALAIPAKTVRKLTVAVDAWQAGRVS
ncbi:MAG: hypothetical protein DI532_20600 [Azospirillum brasilense]|nr:MAG: hypothetical protein DI532_20600 [Azospirillum brasilense]